MPLRANLYSKLRAMHLRLAYLAKQGKLGAEERVQGVRALAART